jgi:hypothetical protein
MTKPDQCFICAAELTPSLAKCPKCGVEVTWLESVSVQVRKSRFLFGQVQQPELDPSQKVAPVAKPAKPRVRKRKPQAVKPAAPMPSVVEVKKPDVADMIRNRDAEIAKLDADEPSAQWGYFLALGLDALICVLCGVIMILGAQLLTDRDLGQLFTFSLMPLVFAIMSFTFLYYCLFWMLLRQTPGMILMGYEPEKTA